MQAIASMLDALSVPSERQLQVDVLAHLQRLLNSRQGQALSAPRYGMALSIDVLREMLTLLPQTTTHIEQAVIACAKAHEPRLAHWQLRAPTELDGQALTLLMAAQSAASKTEMLFDVRISPSGRVTVRSA